ncbi:hypothetical protein DFH09DRAFT_1111914 [Mycena vulgaris]|nr:hypothetical protein DFH09DRAFT_1111914 [Mycena vulgaris]
MSSFTFASENENFGAPNPARNADPAANAPPTAGVTRSTPRTANYKTLRWGEYIRPNQISTLSMRSTAAAVPIPHLKIPDEQRASIAAMYNRAPGASFTVPPIIDDIFPLDRELQLGASAMMAQYRPR